MKKALLLCLVLVSVVVYCDACGQNMVAGGRGGGGDIPAGMSDMGGQYDRTSFQAISERSTLQSFHETSGTF